MPYRRGKKRPSGIGRDGKDRSHLVGNNAVSYPLTIIPVNFYGIIGKGVSIVYESRQMDRSMFFRQMWKIFVELFQDRHVITVGRTRKAASGQTQQWDLLDSDDYGQELLTT